MTRTDILKAAQECVTQSRATTYRQAENSFDAIARLWSAYLELPIEAPITAHDAAAMMALMKLARFQQNPKHSDSAVDLAGYAALMGELGAL